MRFLFAIYLNSLFVSPALSAVLNVIDVHTHAEFTNEIESTSKIAVTEEQYIKELKDAGVVAAVSHTDKDGVVKYRDLKHLNVLQCAAVTSKINAKIIEEGIKSKNLDVLKYISDIFIATPTISCMILYIKLHKSMMYLLCSILVIPTVVKHY